MPACKKWQTGRQEAQVAVKPIRIMEGNAEPNERFWRVADSAEGDVQGEPSIEFYGPISEYIYDFENWTVKNMPLMFKDDLERIGQGGPVTLRIHSGGGDVFAASAIRSILVDYPGRVTARIDGLCASAATMVALGADEIKMQDTAYFMIHDPGYSFLDGWLDAKALSDLAEHLRHMKRSISDVYSERTGITPDEIDRMMHKETWMSAKEALNLGFVDEVIGGKGEKVPMNASVKNAVLNGVNCPLAVEDCSEYGMGAQVVITEKGKEAPPQVHLEPGDPQENSAELDALLDELLVI